MAKKTKSDILIGTDGADTISGVPATTPSSAERPPTNRRSRGPSGPTRSASGFDGAVTAIAAPGDPDHLYVIKKDNGEIYRLDPAYRPRHALPRYPRRSVFSSGGERGVLSLAFHPAYASNGRFFVSVTNPAGDIELREYHAAAGGATFVKSILTVPHPVNANHNGGTILFGPTTATSTGRSATAAPAAIRPTTPRI